MDQVLHAPHSKACPLDMFMVQQTASRVSSCMIPQGGYTLKMIFLPVTGHFIDVFLYLYITIYFDIYQCKNAMVKETPIQSQSQI